MKNSLLVRHVLENGYHRDLSTGSALYWFDVSGVEGFIDFANRSERRMVRYVRGCRFQRYSSYRPSESSVGVDNCPIESLVDTSFGRRQRVADLASETICIRSESGRDVLRRDFRSRA